MGPGWKSARSVTGSGYPVGQIERLTKWLGTGARSERNSYSERHLERIVEDSFIKLIIIILNHLSN